MTIDPARLLKRLEPVVRPVSATGAVVNGRLPLESQGFDELLQLVSHGEVSSGVPVQVNDSITPALEESQLDRLAAAADVAQAAGARRALALLDGRGLVLDVADRSVSEELTGDSSSATITLDAAIFVAGEDEPTDGNVPPPGGGYVPSAVADQIRQLSTEPSPHADRAAGSQRAAG